MITLCWREVMGSAKIGLQVHAGSSGNNKDTHSCGI